MTGEPRDSQIRLADLCVELHRYLMTATFFTTMLVVIVGPCILVSQASIPSIPHPIHHMCVSLPLCPSTMLLLAGTNKYKQRRVRCPSPVW